MSDNTLITSAGLEFSLEEDTQEEIMLPTVILVFSSFDSQKQIKEEKIVCTLSTLEKKSFSISDVRIEPCVRILSSLRKNEVISCKLLIGDEEFSFSSKADAYLTVMGSTCLFSWTDASAE